VSVPVTAKIRSGWDRPIAPRIVTIAEEAGAAALTVHGRTREQGYSGEADWNVVRDCVAAARRIRIIGNGDVRSASEALDRFASSGCDLVMIGRGAMGRPWIFRQIERFLATGETVPEPSLAERLRVCLRHYELAVSLKGPRRAVLEMRPHVAWYSRGMPRSAAFRAEIMSERDPDRVRDRLSELAARYEEGEAAETRRSVER
jgi:tRNA-dihydrouridine synthase B